MSDDISHPRAPRSVGAQRLQTARLVTAGSIAITAAASGATMLLFLGRFGAVSATDGALSAYSLYVLVTVFAQGCRITAAAAVGGDAPRITTTELVWALLASGAALALAMLVFRSPIADLLTGTRASSASPAAQARESAHATLPIFALGVFGQFASVGWSVVLGARGRIAYASASLAVGGIAALASFLLLVPSTGVDALAWSTAVAGGTACLMLAVASPPQRRGAAPRRILFATRLLVVENLVPLFSTIVYVLALIVATNLPDGAAGSSPGVVSQFALSFLACSYLCGILGLSTAIVDTASANTGETSLSQLIQQTAGPALRPIFPLAAAALTVGALAGPRVLELLGPDTAGGDPRYVGVLLLALVPFTFATLAGNVAFSCWYNTRQVTRLNRGVLAAIPIHIGVSVALGAAFGIVGVALATGVTASGFAWWTLRPSPTTASAVALRGGMLAVGVAVGVAAGAQLGAWPAAWDRLAAAAPVVERPVTAR